MPTPNNPTVKEILAGYLREHGFDGLYNGHCECGCGLDDLVPCNEPGEDCRAGHEAPCTCGDCDFHIAASKEGGG